MANLEAYLAQTAQTPAKAEREREATARMVLSDVALVLAEALFSTERTLASVQGLAASDVGSGFDFDSMSILAIAHHLHEQAGRLRGTVFAIANSIG